MMSLEEAIVAKVHPEIAPLWAVADTDGLFRSDTVGRLLAERGVETVVFDDPIAFRYLYETTIRPNLEEELGGCYLILLQPEHEGFHHLPPDVYGLTRKFTIALGDKFPGLSRKVLAELEPATLSRLWEKRDQFPAGHLGDRDTADLVLRIGFRIEPTLLETFDDLVAVLLHLHLAGRRLPDSLAARLQEIMGGAYTAKCDELIRNPGAFWAFLQRAWEQWVLGTNEARASEAGKRIVTFTDQRIRVYIDNLFVEGYLTPIASPDPSHPLPEPWCRVGIESPATGLNPDRLRSQQEKLLAEIPAVDASYRDWLQFAGRYSQHVGAVFSTEGARELVEDFWASFWPQVDARFQPWILDRLDSFHNLPPTRPVVAHHIPDYLRRRVLKNQRVLLLVLDGLSLSQWRVIKPFLQDQLQDVSISEDACFTLIPSVTNVCRQAIYGGELPLFFETTIQRTDCDGKRWKAFWEAADSHPVSSRHGNVQGQDADIHDVEDLLDAGAKAVGLTIRMSDELMHGAQLGWRGMLEQLRLWVSDGFLADVIRSAMERNYEVCLTADHGNLEARGEGGLSQGVLVDISGQRVRVYSQDALRDQAATQLGERAVRFHSKSLPESYLPLVHTGRGAFTPQGDKLVCHGGASLDELIVPFVEFTKTSVSA